MGFGGQTSLIGCKIGALNRLPASFFVSIAYDCWAFRRLGVTLDATTGAITQWLYRDGDDAVDADALARGRRRRASRAPAARFRCRRRSPTSRFARSRSATSCSISGRMFTGRDAVHAHLMKHEPPVDLQRRRALSLRPGRGKKDGDGWQVTAAGPTTSIREEPYQAEILKRYGVRVVIGKGGMGAKTLAGLQESGAVYLNAIGGAAQFYARCIERVDGVSLMEFGTPEAMWHLAGPRFPGDRHHGRARQQPAQGRRRGSRAHPGDAARLIGSKVS